MNKFFSDFYNKLQYSHLIVGSYFLLILAGTLFLLLPISVTGPRLEISQALFTSTSATCVTGLIVVDTGTKFTFFGQMIILILIQLGGLGFMTISTFFLAMIGKKITIKLNLATQEVISQSPIQGFKTTLKYIFFLVISFEAIGAFILFFPFYKSYSLIQSIWYAVFHSISAFCNAGFSLFPDSFNQMAGNPILNMTIMTLIVCGGIGFLVLLELRKNLPLFIKKRNVDSFSLHTKIVLFMTAVLIISGFFIIFFIEKDLSLKAMPLGKQFLVSLFQSITPRTAGFNTITINTLSDTTLVLLMMLMFIGGASGSTAGGIKIGTAYIVFSYIYSILAGKTNTTVFRRKIPTNLVAKAITIFFLGILFIALSVCLLNMSITDEMDTNGKGQFISLLFECFSALGTVGLSLGVTPSLNIAGRFIIIVLMFLGRIGPLLLALTLLPKKETIHYEFPEENIMIG